MKTLEGGVVAMKSLVYVQKKVVVGVQRTLGQMDWNRLENEHAWFCMSPTAFEAEGGGPDDPC